MEETSKEYVWTPGDTVYLSEPFAQVVYFLNRTKYCDNCFNTKRARKKRRSASSRSLIPCKGCNFVHYCSRECQKEAWGCHRKECEVVKTYVDDPPYYCDFVRLIIKVIIKLEGKNLNDVKDVLGIENVDFESLISSCTWPDHPDIITFLSFMHCYLNECLGETNLPENVDNIIITVEKNRFDIQRIGTAFYIGASNIKRVCIPTAAFYFLERSTMCVRVTKMIPAESSMLSISRFSFMDGHNLATTTRALILGECTCSECTDPKNSLLYRIIDESIAEAALESSIRVLEMLHLIAESGRKKLEENENYYLQEVLKLQESAFGRFHFYRIRLLAGKVYFESDLRQKACDLSTLFVLLVGAFGKHSDQLMFVLEERFEVAKAMGWSAEKKSITTWYQNLCDVLYN